MTKTIRGWMNQIWGMFPGLLVLKLQQNTEVSVADQKLDCWMTTYVPSDRPVGISRLP